MTGLGQRRRVHVAGIATGVLCIVCSAAPAQLPPLDTERVAEGLSNPLFAIAPAGDTGRLFVAEQGNDGTAHIKLLNLSSNTVSPTPFLSIPGLATGGEQGLLGLAFHPDYSNNGLFYVNVTAPGGEFDRGITQIREYGVSGNPLTATTANPTPTRTLLSIDQPQANHNGGWIGFSPRAGDAGNLYIATGDGGASNDVGPGHIEPGGNAQNTGTLLGKMLRINVDSDDFPTDADRNYGIPLNNPFIGTGGEPEIFAYGLRNPFRASFDRSTGHMYIGDVGQNNREEVDFQSANNPGGGENYQWRLREGNIETPTGGVGGPPPPGSTGPIDDYPRDVGSTVTGGYVYRGTDIPGLQGAYIYGDFGSGRIFALRHDGTSVTMPRTEITGDLDPGNGMTIDNPSSFAEDARGEMYIIDYDGEIYKIVPEPSAAALLALLLGPTMLRRRRS